MSVDCIVDSFELIDRPTDSHSSGERCFRSTDDRQAPPVRHVVADALTSLAVRSCSVAFVRATAAAALAAAAAAAAVEAPLQLMR